MTDYPDLLNEEYKKANPIPWTSDNGHRPQEIPSEPESSLDELHQPQVSTSKKDKKPVPTDLQLAKRWLVDNPLTAWGMGEFRRYTDGIWPVLPMGKVEGGIENILEVAELEGVRPTAARLASVAKLAGVKVAIDDDKWDADPDVLICKNGALHIPTRTLQPHDPTHYATSALSFDYDPAAQAPVFEFVLNACLPEAKEFLQQFAGYALTTETKYEIAVWFFGPAGSGKSTILEGLQAMLGARAGLLGLADIERSRFALTELPGKTLVVSAEQPAAYMAATHILNRMISGEPITVERKFINAMTFRPRVKLIWAMNELPRVSGAEDGLFRRVKVIKFPQIPEDQRDPKIKEAVKLEGAGILNWALEGLAILRAAGRFIIPACVQDATKHFRDTNDIPSLFVDECCIIGSDKRAQGQVLYDAYREWCLRNGHKPQSSTSIAEDWRRLGFEKYRAAGRTFWSGVGVATTETPQYGSDVAGVAS